MTRYQHYYRGGLPVADGAADLAERLLIAEHLPLDKHRVERSRQADVAVDTSSGAIAGGVDRGKHRIHRAVRVLKNRACINTLRVVTMVRDDCDGVLRPVHKIARAEVACQMLSQLACTHRSTLRSVVLTPIQSVAAMTGVYAVDKDVPHNRLSTQIRRLSLWNNKLGKRGGSHC